MKLSITREIAFLFRFVSQGICNLVTESFRCRVDGDGVGKPVPSVLLGLYSVSGSGCWVYCSVNFNNSIKYPFSASYICNITITKILFIWIYNNNISFIFFKYNIWISSYWIPILNEINIFLNFIFNIKF